MLNLRAVTLHSRKPAHGDLAVAERNGNPIARKRAKHLQSSQARLSGYPPPPSNGTCPRANTEKLTPLQRDYDSATLSGGRPGGGGLFPSRGFLMSSAPPPRSLFQSLATASAPSSSRGQQRAESGGSAFEKLVLHVPPSQILPPPALLAKLREEFLAEEQPRL